MEKGEYKLTNKMTNNELNSFLKKVARCESYENKSSNDAWGFNKGVRATLHALGYDKHWIETTFRDEYEDYIARTDWDKK